MITVNIFLAILFTRATENLQKTLNNIVAIKKDKKQYSTYDINKYYEVDYIIYDIKSNHDQIDIINDGAKTTIITDHYEYVFEKCKEMLFHKRNSTKSPRILIFDKNYCNSKKYKRVIDNLQRYNLQNKLKENSFYYEVIAERDSLIYDCVIDNISELNFIKSDRPFYYYLCYQNQGIYYFFNINILDFKPQKIFTKHLKNQFLLKKYDKRFLFPIVVFFDFLDLNEIYGIPQYIRKETYYDGFLDASIHEDNFSTFHYIEDAVIHIHKENVTLFSYRKEIENFTDITIKKIIMEESSFMDLKRLVIFSNTNQRNMDEINVLFKIIKNNFPIIRILKNIFRHKDSAVHIFLKEILISCNLINNNEWELLMKNIDLLGSNMASPRMKKNFKLFIAKFINYISSKNIITYTVKICIIMEFEEIINVESYIPDIFITLKNFLNSIYAKGNKEKIDLITIFEEMLKYKEIISKSVHNTWDDIFDEFTAFEKKEKNK
ncbi:uncharacterized protein VNE69_04041 [Vairimorpha necatrix]|uniref:Uncharacterized protein n=1 Tax=Vairimorpha necatrix TaxID=6039 RepID=A0AAX4JBF3_9MICR